MQIIVSKDAYELGQKAAAHTADLLRQAVSQKGTARLLLSTGASQFTTLEALVTQEVPWDKVEMFHLDEYINIAPDHPASFVKYLNERFISKVKLKAAHLIDTAQGVETIIAKTTEEIEKAPIDVGLIGIGENAHIAFNDPPADFDDEAAFKVVTLDEACRCQQWGEGWFERLEDVPTHAVSMTPKQILRCRHILSAVPFKVKAKAVYDTLTSPDVTPMIPATILTTKPEVTLYLDSESASMVDAEILARFS